MANARVGVGHFECGPSRFLTPPPRIAGNPAGRGNFRRPSRFFIDFSPARTSRRARPSHRERMAPDGPHLDWNLIVGRADPPERTSTDGADVIEPHFLKNPTRPSFLGKLRTRTRAPWLERFMLGGATFLPRSIHDVH